MIHRYAEKTLNLRGMEIHGKDPPGTCCGNNVRHELGGNRDPWGYLPILSGITIIWQYCRNSPGRCPSQGIHHYEKFHHIVIYRRTSRLDHIYIRPSHIFPYLHVHFTITEGFHGCPAKRHAQVVTYFLSQGRISISSKDYHMIY
ncbi:hypothetical protein ES703_114113 [subsurface metagenome]